ncbi:methyltransferase domain-containing protein [Fretibacter rubidus]|uniref:methyltransferase domain-containing protein n=1 Tax=Fretibacter rubidus TaxID=570162 RepID=UPI00352A67CB
MTASEPSSPQSGTPTPQKTAPHVFDAELRRIRRARAVRRAVKSDKPAFFIPRCAEDAADRMQDINRRFERALIIGPPDFWPQLRELLPTDKHPTTVVQAYDIDPDDAADFGLDIGAPDDGLPIDGPKYDLIISVLSLHSVNDLPGALLNMRHILKADGLMMASLFGGDSLRELRTVFYSVEAERLGGMSPRIFPMIDFSQAAQLLQRTGYALPVVDTDRFTVNYGALSTLIGDIRDSGDSNVAVARDRRHLSRDFLKALEAAYRAQFSNEAGKITASFEILWMTGWAPHDSQQKPLKPGSAKMRLSDALGAKEIKI